MEEKMICITKKEYDELVASKTLLDQLHKYFDCIIDYRLSFDKKSLISEYDSFDIFKFLFPFDYIQKLEYKIKETTSEE